MFQEFAVYSGLVATIWIFVGVYAAGRFYDGYDHVQQFCSELGAKGSPTEKLSPRINNYPLGLLFCVFGWHVASLDNASLLIVTSGYLVIAHGLGTWVAGYFPMDKDPYTKNPTFACLVHSWAGFVMLLSLVIAPVLIAISPSTDLIPFWFRLFSLLSVMAAVYFLFVMAKAIKEQNKPGLHQRLSYGFQLLWLSVFSMVLA